MLRLDYIELEVFTRFGGMVDARTRKIMESGGRIRAVPSQDQYQPQLLAVQIELADFLQFAFYGTDTTLSVDVDGASEFGTPEFQDSLLGVDLVGTTSTQAEVIDGLLAGSQLKLV